MTLNELLQKMKIDIKPYVEIGQHKVLNLKVEGKKTSVLLNDEALTKVSDDAGRILLTMANMDFLMKIEGFLTAEIFGNGPKVFRPTSYQLEMLEEMQLTLACEDYNMPFETIVIEIPAEYSAKKICGDAKPAFAWLHHDKKQNFFIHSIVFDKEPFHSLKSWWAGNEKDELEEWCQSDYSIDDKFDRLPTTEQEYLCEAQVRRAVLNYCLLLDEVGIKKCGPEAPNQYAKLVKWCQKKTKHTKNNKIELLAQPIIYDLQRETPLVRVITEDQYVSELGTHTGRKLPAHARRGYYRMQRYGVGNSLKKRIRIPRCIVNKHLLTGPIGATYRT
jgi:hypothetical protein